jgi:hypothetical protein
LSAGDRCRSERRPVEVAFDGRVFDRAVHSLDLESHVQLRSHLCDFVNAYNFARRLKTLKGLTPYEFICKQWTSQPERFTANPLQKIPGLNI